MSQKKYVSLSKLQTFLENLSNKFSALGHKHTIADIADYKVDSSLSSTSTNPVQNAIIDAEFEAVSTAMSVLDAEVDTKATANHGIYYGTCDDGASTVIKHVTLTDATGFSLTTGTVVIIKFKYSNTASNPMMNVNMTGAKYMKRQGTIAVSSSSSYGWQPGAVSIFVYDGENWVRDYWYNSTYSNVGLGHGYGICDTEESDTTKVVTATGLDAVAGGFVSVRFTNAVPANSVLDINSSHDKAIYYNGELIPDGIIRAGDTATFVYDGTDFHLIAINTDAYSKADQTLTMIYDSGEITESVNTIVADVDISGYKTIQIVVQNVNDGSNTVNTSGSAILTSQNGTTYQFPMFNSLFGTTSGRVSGSFAHFKIIDGWIVCQDAANINSLTRNIFSDTDDGTVTKFSVHGGSGIARCTSPLSTIAVTSYNYNANAYFGVGSRIMVWGCRA